MSETGDVIGAHQPLLCLEARCGAYVVQGYLHCLMEMGRLIVIVDILGMADVYLMLGKVVLGSHSTFGSFLAKLFLVAS